jgi:hypothetical protein
MLQVSKTQYSGQNIIQHNENITYIKRNSIVQIGKSIAYKIKWILKNITARFFPKVGMVFAICLK